MRQVVLRRGFETAWRPTGAGKYGLSGRLRARTLFTWLRASAQPEVLYQAQTAFNQVQVIQIPDEPPSPAMAELAGARILLLDLSGNIHSVWRPGPPMPTHSYWDVLSTLPGLCPGMGTMGILGLGAGTLARMVHHYYPTQQMAGWELDPAVIMAARMHFGMQELEAAGVLAVHAGDAFAPEAAIPGGFGCIAVDIFSEGALPELMIRPATWQAIRAKLSTQPGARVMVNLGQAAVGPVPGRPARPEGYTTLRALDAMLEVFGEGQVSVIELPNLDGSDPTNANCVAVTGSPEALQAAWEAGMPADLKYLTARGAWRTFAWPKLPF